MKAWECSACGGKSFTRLDAHTVMCDYCETRFTLTDEEPANDAQGSGELRKAKAAALVAEAAQMHEQQKLQEEIRLLLQALELDEQNAEVCGPSWAEPTATAA